MDINPSASGTMKLMGYDNSVVDEIDFDHQLNEDVSSGRSTDGSPMWAEFSIPTPRVTNTPANHYTGNVVINEAQRTTSYPIRMMLVNLRIGLNYIIQRIHPSTSQAIFFPIASIVR